MGRRINQVAIITHRRIATVRHMWGHAPDVAHIRQLRRRKAAVQLKRGRAPAQGDHSKQRTTSCVNLDSMTTSFCMSPTPTQQDRQAFNERTYM